MGIHQYLGQCLSPRPIKPFIMTTSHNTMSRHQRNMQDQRVFLLTRFSLLRKKNKASSEISPRTPTAKPAIMDASIIWSEMDHESEGPTTAQEQLPQLLKCSSPWCASCRTTNYGLYPKDGVKICIWLIVIKAKNMYLVLGMTECA